MLKATRLIRFCGTWRLPESVAVAYQYADGEPAAIFFSQLPNDPCSCLYGNAPFQERYAWRKGTRHCGKQCGLVCSTVRRFVAPHA